jgi:hypothetical protein
MDLALALLLLWGIFFTPTGIFLHWLVLGPGARVRALSIAPVTGIAFAFVVLAALGRLGVDAGETWVSVAFLGVSIASAIAIWRLEIPWRSRELIGAGVLLLFATLLVQLPVVGADGDGPLGYGTAASPVSEVAAIDAAAHGPAARLGVARDEESSRDERSIGFEQFAAMTVGIGLADNPKTSRDAAWTAYGMHSAITGMLAALIALPLFAFARARGVKWLGLAVLVPLGVLAPAVFLALANGEGAAIASVPFTTAAVYSLLVARRDRGWWALVVLFGAAVASSAGPIALMPLVLIGVAWMFLRSDTYEHLSQHDAPVARIRTLVVTAGAAALGALACAPLLESGGDLLAWTGLHSSLAATLRSWPFAWLDSNLATAGPESTLEIAIWLIGPALLAVALAYAVVRNERRELGVLVGSVLAALVAAGIGLIEKDAGIRLYEFTMLSLSPFLAALAIRAVSLARENADDAKGTPEGRWGGTGPTLLVAMFVLLSFAATAVTGTRMVHAPAVDFEAASSAKEGNESTLIAAGDPWLEFVVDGERVDGGSADADELAEPHNGLSRYGLRPLGGGKPSGYDRVVLSSSPLASDPPLRYLESSELDNYQVRLFRDLLSTPTPSDDFQVDTARALQRNKTETADRPGSEDTSSTASSDVAEATRSPRDLVLPALRHDPVEGDDAAVRPGEPAGLLLPSGDVPACPVHNEQVPRPSCEPAEPEADGTDCTDEDIAAARSPLDRRRAKPRTGGSGRLQVLQLEPDAQLSAKPPMIGVQCFDVPLDKAAGVLLVHLRDVGQILPPESARRSGPSGAWSTEHQATHSGSTKGVGGGERRTTSSLDAALTYGDDALLGSYDLVLEGEFGAGVNVSSNLQLLTQGSDTTVLTPNVLDTLRGSADGFGKILRNVAISGTVTITNGAGTDVSLGRLFARPRDLPPSCDVPIALADDEQREIRLDIPERTGAPARERPGLAVTVVKVSGTGARRTARVAIATYLSRAGLPRYTLVDWTEQYEGNLDVEGCDGTITTETGASPEVGADDSPEAGGADVSAALGSDAETP